MALFLPYLYYVYCLLYFLGKDIRFLLNTSDTVILSSSGRLATGLLCVLVLQKTLFFCTELPWNFYHEELFNSVNSVFCWDDHVTLEWKQLDCMHRLHMLANFWKYFVEDFRSCCMIGLSCFPHHSPFPPLSFPPTNLAPQQAPPQLSHLLFVCGSLVLVLHIVSCLNVGGGLCAGQSSMYQ